MQLVVKGYFLYFKPLFCRFLFFPWMCLFVVVFSSEAYFELLTFIDLPLLKWHNWIRAICKNCKKRKENCYIKMRLRIFCLLDLPPKTKQLMAQIFFPEDSFFQLSHIKSIFSIKSWFFLERSWSFPKKHKLLWNKFMNA